MTTTDSFIGPKQFLPPDSAIDLQHIRLFFDIIAGNVRALAWAFVWRDTPQGQDHWVDRADGVVPLSDDDVEFLHNCIRHMVETLITRKRVAQILAEDYAEDYADDLEAY